MLPDLWAKLQIAAINANSEVFLCQPGKAIKKKKQTEEISWFVLNYGGT